MEPLSREEIEQETAGLDGWRVGDEGRCIERDFKFRDFVAAFSFMTAVALKAERMDHHPDWSNVYSRVEVRLSTHEAGGVTERDFALARFMDEVAAN